MYLSYSPYFFILSFLFVSEFLLVRLRQIKKHCYVKRFPGKSNSKLLFVFVERKKFKSDAFAFPFLFRSFIWKKSNADGPSTNRVRGR